MACLGVYKQDWSCLQVWLDTDDDKLHDYISLHVFRVSDWNLLSIQDQLEVNQEEKEDDIEEDVHISSKYAKHENIRKLKAAIIAQARIPHK